MHSIEIKTNPKGNKRKDFFRQSMRHMEVDAKQELQDQKISGRSSEIV
jgi:hypothetical protein